MCPRDNALAYSRFPQRRVARSTTYQTFHITFEKLTTGIRQTLLKDELDNLQSFDMTAEEIEESQSVVEDGGMGGPGAPTPLSALEVSSHNRRNLRRI